MTNNPHTAPRGFTLIETLLAVLILITSIVGPLTVAHKGFTTATMTREQVTAYYLAQDAIEFIRYARDSNQLAGTNWITGTTNLNECQQVAGCSIESTGGTVGAGSSALKYDSATGKYTTNGNGPVTYTRATKILTVVGAPSESGFPTEYLASTTVSWSGQGGTTHSVTIFENIFKWQ